MQTCEYKITEKFTEERINEILRIEKEEGLTPESFLEHAKKKSSPLHGLYSEEQWDDTYAAHQYRLHMARCIINEVKIIIEQTEVYAFENVKVSISNPVSEDIANASERRYVSTVNILNDSELKKQIVASAINSLKYWKTKYQFYSEFKGLIKSIDKFIKTMAYSR